MANGRVIATGGAPPDPNQLLLGQGAAGVGGGLGALLGQGIATRRSARDLDPQRQAILDFLGGRQPRNPVEAALFASMQDPLSFAKTVERQGGVAQVADMIGAPPKEASAVDRVIDGGSELGRELGLQPGERARVRFSRDAAGNVISRSVVANPFSEDEDEEFTRFGKGDRGRSLAFVANLAPGFAENRLTPDQERFFLTAVSNLTQREEFTDPDTQLLVTRRPELPGFVQRALAVRGFSVGDQGIVPPLAQPPNPADVAAFQDQAQQATALGTPQDAIVGSRPAETPTLFEMAARGDINSPIPAIQRFLTRFGLQAQPEMNARTAAVTLKERVVKALQQSPRYAEGEAQRIGTGFQFDPEILATNSRYMQRAIAADDVLARIQQENFEVITGKRALVPGETREHAMATLNAITNARNWLIPPRVENVEQLDQFLRTSTPGTMFLVPGEREGTWDLFQTPEQQ